MRNISFSMTTPQVRSQQKDVTRRLGWEFLKVGDRLQGCVKCMGLKKGEKLEVLAVIEVVKVSREPLRDMLDNYLYGISECRREGFPYLTPAEFVDFFCAGHKGCTPDTIITRIQFRYAEEDHGQPA